MRANACTACKACLHIQVGPCIGQQAQQVRPVRPVCRQHGGGPPAKVDKERQAVWNQELRAGATSRESDRSLSMAAVHLRTCRSSYCETRACACYNQVVYATSSHPAWQTLHSPPPSPCVVGQVHIGPCLHQQLCGFAMLAIHRQHQRRLQTWKPGSRAARLAQ